MAVNMGYNLQKRQSGYKFIPEPAPDDFGANLLYLDEPPWVPNESTETCQRCGKHFSFSRRRHHCRRCGDIFCGNCAKFTVPLRRMNFFDPVRQCGPCAEISKTEVPFFADKIRILSYGANFEGLLPNATTPTQMGARQLFAYISNCNRFVVIEQKDITGLSRKMELKIKLSDIIAAKFTTSNRKQGTHQAGCICGVQLYYGNPAEISQSGAPGQRISMVPSRLYGADAGETACQWLDAFLQALQFVSERLSPERSITLEKQQVSPNSS